MYCKHGGWARTQSLFKKYLVINDVLSKLVQLSVLQTEVWSGSEHPNRWANFSKKNRDCSKKAILKE